MVAIQHDSIGKRILSIDSSTVRQQQQQQQYQRSRYSCIVILLLLGSIVVIVLCIQQQQVVVVGVVDTTNTLSRTNQLKTAGTIGGTTLISIDTTNDSMLYNTVTGWYEKFIEGIYLLRIIIRNPDFKNPFRTVDPIPIELVPVVDTTKTKPATTRYRTTNNTYEYYYHRMEQNRHECIRYIRMEHTKLLIPYLTATNKPIQKKQSSISKINSQNNTNIVDSILTLVDPAYHGNVGDHMLTLAEIRFIKKNYYYPNNNNNNNPTTIFQCTYDQGGYGFYIPRCNNLLQRQKRKQQQQQHQRKIHPSNTTTRFVALWQAGGNWGDLYTKTQLPRIRSFETLLLTGYDTIIGLPQSYYYKNPVVEQKDALYLQQSIRRAYISYSRQKNDHSSFVRERSFVEVHNNNNNNSTAAVTNPTVFQQEGQEEYKVDIEDNDWVSYSKQRIILTWREQSSYEKAKKIYPFVTNLVVPDMAFELGPFSGREILQSSSQSNIKMVDIVFFLRADTESIYSQYRRHPHKIQHIINTVHNNKLQQIQQHNTNIDVSTNKQLSFVIYDWSSRYQVFTKDNFFFTNTSIQLVASGKVVIADRLHAVILSYLSGLPIIYLDNIYQKINKTLSVAFRTWDGCTNNKKDAMYDSTTNFTTAIERAIDFIYDYQVPEMKTNN